MQTLSDYKTELLKKRGPKEVKVTNSWGVYDCYKAIRKHNWFNIGRPLKEAEFYAIIRGINNLLAQEIAKGNTIDFPARMGSLELRKYKKGVSIVDGKLKNTYPIDWGKTMNLWFEDKEARESKILIRDEQPWVFHVKYCISKAKYENKTFYQFVLNRKIKLALMNNIKQGKIDTLW